MHRMQSAFLKKMRNREEQSFACYNRRGGLGVSLDYKLHHRFVLANRHGLFPLEGRRKLSLALPPSSPLHNPAGRKLVISQARLVDSSVEYFPATYINYPVGRRIPLNLSADLILKFKQKCLSALTLLSLVTQIPRSMNTCCVMRHPGIACISVCHGPKMPSHNRCKQLSA